MTQQPPYTLEIPVSGIDAEPEQLKENVAEICGSREDQDRYSASIEGLLSSLSLRDGEVLVDEVLETIEGSKIPESSNVLETEANTAMDEARAVIAGLVRVKKTPNGKTKPSLDEDTLEIDVRSDLTPLDVRYIRRLKEDTDLRAQRIRSQKYIPAGRRGNRSSGRSRITSTDRRIA